MRHFLTVTFDDSPDRYVDVPLGFSLRGEIHPANADLDRAPGRNEGEPSPDFTALGKEKPNSHGMDYSICPSLQHTWYSTFADQIASGTFGTTFPSLENASARVKPW